ncbi:hypothetical protein [Actinotignum urinale]|uniref:hypothetical protein n=1 Tax=Actinotignum urinale TaxID=190146 RepID=UPI00280B92A3|nr:hypothetical protein [Actinotignum urinale]
MAGWDSGHVVHLLSEKRMATYVTAADGDLDKAFELVARLLGNMTFVRNRAAHLKPMFRRDVERDVAEARALMAWIDPQALAWFNDTLKLDEVLAAKPAFLK